MHVENVRKSTGFADTGYQARGARAVEV